MLLAFSSSLMQPLHVGPHHMPHKPLDSISTDLTPSSFRKPSLNLTLNVDLALKEKLSYTGGSQPGRNYCSLSFLKQIRHGQYISACQALSHSPCASASFLPTHQISLSIIPNPCWHHHFNFTASGTSSWSKQLAQESLLFGSDGLQQLSSGWLLNVPLGLLLFVCFPSARLQSRGQTKAEPVNVTKHFYVNIMEQDLLFPLASKLDFSRELLQSSTQQPPKGTCTPWPSYAAFVPLVGNETELPTQLGCAALAMEPCSFPLLEGLSRKRSAAVLQNTNHLGLAKQACQNLHLAHQDLPAAPLGSALFEWDRL